MIIVAAFHFDRILKKCQAVLCLQSGINFIALNDRDFFLFADAEEQSCGTKFIGVMEYMVDSQGF